MSKLKVVGVTKKSGNKATVKTSVNPWLNAKDSWRDRYAQLANSQLWSLVIACCAAVMMLAAMALSMAANNKSQYIPYVVAVDDHGVAINSGFAKQMTKADDKVVASLLAQFIVSSRSVTVDVSYLKKNIDWVFAHLEENTPARAYITEWYTGGQGVQNPVKRAETELVSVKVTSILKQSKNTFTVEWIESTRSRNGERLKPDMTMKAVISYTYGKIPNGNDVIGIQNNPLGIYLSQISWGQKSVN